VCVLGLWCIAYVQYVLWIQTFEGSTNQQRVGIRKKQRSNDLLVQQFRFALWGEKKSVQNSEVPEESLVQVRCVLRYTESNSGDKLCAGVIRGYV
jgi:hypothetical protein